MAKNIVLCSDGTGNKGGYGADSNVFKLYLAVDIHQSTPRQITYYDNGIGTSSNKYWRAFTGAFGFGCEANVCDLYEELARNYDFGDRIYVFGFSRGAATVRAFTGFIKTCGLLSRVDDNGNPKSEALFQQQLAEAIEAYKDKSSATEFKAKHAIKNATYAPDGDLKITFIGVWDTVSALGFPQDWSVTLDWLFKWLDKASDKIFPHRFYNYNITDNIEYGCQALAIDDARKTFKPRVWIEGSRDPTSGKWVWRDPASVEQVWFAGAHSNVGGGYPRSGLSDVALAWMMERAKHHGLNFIKDAQEAAVAAANVQGKLYDSREGFGVYYRYQPRIIEKLCKYYDDGSREGKNKLIGPIKIHESVLKRVKRGTARYAPGFLPAAFDVVETPVSSSPKPVALDAEDWSRCHAEADKWVKRRQYLYHAFVETTFVLLLFSIIFWVSPPASVEAHLANCCGEVTGACPLAGVASLLLYILPSMFENFIVYITCVHPFIFVLMIAVLVTMFLLRKKFLNGLTNALEESRKVLIKIAE